MNRSKRLLESINKINEANLLKKNDKIFLNMVTPDGDERDDYRGMVEFVYDKNHICCFFPDLGDLKSLFTELEFVNGTWNHSENGKLEDSKGEIITYPADGPVINPLVSKCQKVINKNIDFCTIKDVKIEYSLNYSVIHKQKTPHFNIIFKTTEIGIRQLSKLKVDNLYDGEYLGTFKGFNHKAIINKNSVCFEILQKDMEF